MVQNINPVQTTASSPTEPKCISFHSSRLWPCYTVGKHYLHDRAMMRNRRLLPDYVGLQFAALTLCAFALPCLSRWLHQLHFSVNCQWQRWQMTSQPQDQRAQLPARFERDQTSFVDWWSAQCQQTKNGPNVKWTKGLMDYSTMLIWTTRSSVWCFWAPQPVYSLWESRHSNKSVGACGTYWKDW